mmetsp:Transcript_65877/g.120086  ORF Transcript_65877/g.120086 Transcript_65877/m.120086 type:complete len:127 (+) Transcript_65877:144-524(+)
MTQVNCTKVATSAHLKNASRSGAETLKDPITAGHHIICAERKYFRKLKNALFWSSSNCTENQLLEKLLPSGQPGNSNRLAWRCKLVAAFAYCLSLPRRLLSSFQPRSCAMENLPGPLAATKAKMAT